MRRETHASTDAYVSARQVFNFAFFVLDEVSTPGSRFPSLTPRGHDGVLKTATVTVRVRVTSQPSQSLDTRLDTLFNVLRIAPVVARCVARVELGSLVCEPERDRTVHQRTAHRRLLLPGKMVSGGCQTI